MKFWLVTSRRTSASGEEWYYLIWTIHNTRISQVKLRRGDGLKTEHMEALSGATFSGVSKTLRTRTPKSIKTIKYIVIFTGEGS